MEQKKLQKKKERKTKQSLICINNFFSFILITNQQVEVPLLLK
ncbi:unnamed protein product [Paramecium sonneborni]|uniref:Uncharacterized protein n=1 Tax=Paramecium sonneborni TaxID=65129 RepID=A0A8S1MDK1_9CILI|nr:unnamed protein product [Paramecium sonneborni]